LFCNACGQQVPDGSAFCNNCGAPVANVATPALSTNYRIVSKKKTNKRGGCLLVLLGSIILTAIVSNLPNSSTRSIDTDKAKRVEEQKARDEVKFGAMTPAQHIKQAEDALRPGATTNAISEGFQHLKAIPQSAAESARAKLVEQRLIKARNAATAKLVETFEHERLAKLSPLERATEGTKLVKFSWRKEAFDNVMVATFTIRNNSPDDVKDIEIGCEHSAPSGTVIDRNTRTIYEVVKAHATRTFADFNMGFIHSQAARSGCKILTVKLASEH